MKKSSSPNLPNVINWWWAEVNQVDIQPHTQLAMFHFIMRLNENFWKPIRISFNQFAAVMNSDKRTVKKSIDELISLGYINEKDGVYSVGHCYYGRYEQSRESDSTGLDDSSSRQDTFSQSGSERSSQRLPLQSESDNGILRNPGETPPVKRRKYFTNYQSDYQIG